MSLSNILKRKNTKTKYYDMTDLLNCDCTYNYMLSQRSKGKSYQTKKYVLDKCIKNDECFFYIRRLKTDIETAYVETYFHDMYDYILEISEGAYNAVIIETKCFYLCFLDSEGKKSNMKRLGYIRALSESGRVKSNNYDDVTSIVFEEFIDEDANYLKNEINKFTSIISTVCRDNRLKVFMIGNMLDRTCPYFYHHQLIGVPKQEPGTIAIYKHSTGTFDSNDKEVFVTIAVEVLPDGEKKASHMFTGLTQKNVMKSSWSEKEQPTIKLKSYHEKIYTVFFEREYLKYIADFYIDTKTGDCFWFVTHKETELRITPTMRIISDRIYNNPMCTNSLTPLSSREDKMFNYFRENKVYYSNNLTGTEFKKCLAWYRSAHYLT